MRGGKEKNLRCVAAKMKAERTREAAMPVQKAGFVFIGAVPFEEDDGFYL